MHTPLEEEDLVAQTSSAFHSFLSLGISQLSRWMSCRQAICMLSVLSLDSRSNLLSELARPLQFLDSIFMAAKIRLVLEMS